MPRPSRITADLVREVRQRRAAGEGWKRILHDLAERGLPAGRVTWFRVLLDVPEHQASGHGEDTRCTAG
jgi:hypothetical protein